MRNTRGKSQILPPASTTNITAAGKPVWLGALLGLLASFVGTFVVLMLMSTSSYSSSSNNGYSSSSSGGAVGAEGEGFLPPPTAAGHGGGGLLGSSFVTTTQTPTTATSIIAPRCTTRFIRYIPSPFEQAWQKAAKAHVVKREGLCSLLTSTAPITVASTAPLANVGGIGVSGGNTMIHTTGGTTTATAMITNSFYNWSKVYMDDCAAGKLARHDTPTHAPSASRRLASAAGDGDTSNSKGGRSSDGDASGRSATPNSHSNALLDPEVYSALEYERVCAEGADGYEDTAYDLGNDGSSSSARSSGISSTSSSNHLPNRPNPHHRLHVTADWEEDVGVADDNMLFTNAAAGSSCASGGSGGGAVADIICGGRADGRAFKTDVGVGGEANADAEGSATSRRQHPLTRHRIRRTRYRTYIEPLVGLLRDPRICAPERYAKNRQWQTFMPTKDWLAVTDGNDKHSMATIPGRRNGEAPTTKKSGASPQTQQDAGDGTDGSTTAASSSSQRRFLFDLGASSWSEGSGGASQSWFYHTYRQFGSDFNAIYAWELTQVNGKVFFKSIPDHLKPIYHYFNYGMTAATGHWDNPLNHIVQRTHPDDFVVLKIDIDAGAIEGSIVDEIVANKALYERIDELYFEHHVWMEKLKYFFKWTLDKRNNYEDSIRMFSNLRKRGIRAHSWV